MTRITAYFKNYKLLKDKSIEMESGNLYMVKASNNSGKTSMLQGLLTLFKGKNGNKDILTHGEKEGTITAQVVNFKGADGQDYTIKFDFAEGKDDKFTIIRPDTTVSKKPTDIAAIFKYNDFTVDDWFSWGLTAEGKRKQAQIIMNMLPEDVLNRIKVIDEKTNSRNGTLFTTRTKTNLLYDLKKQEHDQIALSSEEEQMLSRRESWEAETNKVKEDLAKAKEFELKSEGIFAKLDSLKENVKRYEGDIERLTNDGVEDERNTLAEIKLLQDRITSLKEKYAERVTEREQVIAGTKISIEEGKKRIEEVQKEIPEEASKTAELQARVDKRKLYDDILVNAVTKTENKQKLLKEVQDAFKAKNDLTDEIEQLRKEKISLISKANLPVNNVVIEDDELYYIDKQGEQLPFNESSVSYSEGGLIVAKIMLAVNKELPLLLVGKAAEYDKAAKQELVKLAEANNAIIICDQVVQDKAELQIECYDVGAKEEKVTTANVSIEPNVDSPINLPTL